MNKRQYEKSIPLKEMEEINLGNKNLKDFKIYKIYSSPNHPSLWVSYNSNIKRVEVKYNGLLHNEEDVNSILKDSFKDIIFKKVEGKSWTFATKINLDDKKDLDNFVNTLVVSILRLDYFGYTL